MSEAGRGWQNQALTPSLQLTEHPNLAPRMLALSTASQNLPTAQALKSR